MYVNCSRNEADAYTTWADFREAHHCSARRQSIEYTQFAGQKV